ncbi:MAG: TonB-dependent receptor [Gammaproteobacteria bacterium]|nr:TonB-dependent receptor [Gammaproteobacteria bacterium]
MRAHVFLTALLVCPVGAVYAEASDNSDEFDFLFEEIAPETSESEAAELELDFDAEPAESAESETPTEPAQEVTETAETKAVVSTRRRIEEVIVTSQKTEQTLQEVPASVSALDGDFIRESGAFDINKIQNYAPNTEIRLSPTGGSFRIRGLGSQSTNAATEPSVGTVVDGVFYGRSHFLYALFNDIERIEILRGPQGSLFGKNTTAGVMNVTTRKPGNETAGSIDYLYGSYGERAVKPGLDIPISEQFNLRYSGVFQENPGLQFNTLLNRFERNISQETHKLRAVYDASDSVTWDWIFFRSIQGLNHNNFQFHKLTPAMLDYQRDYDPLVEDDSHNDLLSANVPARGDVKVESAQMNVEWDIPGLWDLYDTNITSITSWARHITYRRDIDADFGPSPVIKDSLISPSPFTQLQQEIRFSGAANDVFGWGGEVRFVTGLFLFHSKLAASDLFELEDANATLGFFAAANGAPSPTLPLPAIGGLSLNDLQAQLVNAVGNNVPLSAEVTLDEDARSAALFGQFEHDLSDTLGWLFGFRYGVDKKDGFFTSQSDSQAIKAIAGQEDHRTRVVRREEDLSPKLGFTWQPSEQAGAYGTWSRGFKSGGFNALPLNDNNLEYEPERATSLELGYKGKLLDGSMNLNFAVFRTDFENLQLSTFGGEDGSTATFIILNAGEARSEGAEMDITWLPPIPGATVVFNIGYADAYFTSYPEAPAIAGTEDDPNTPDYDESRFQDLQGKPLPKASKWSAGLSPSFTLPLPFSDNYMNVGVDVQYRSGVFLDVDLDPETYQGAITEVNARVTFAGPEQRAFLTFGAQNLTDERILDEVLDQPLASGNYAAIRRDNGRFYTANLRYEF